MRWRERCGVHAGYHRHAAGVSILRHLAAVIEIITPGTCAMCGIPGPVACAPCLSVLPRLVGAGCECCGHPWPQEVATCPQCPPAVAWTRQALEYDPSVARLMSALKDSRRRGLVAPIVALMDEVLVHPPDGAVLVPVPLTRARLAERGFNQASLLAAALGSAWAMPVSHALVRADDGTHQRGASRSARAGQVAGAFAAVGTAPHHAVIVDDVLTTGATLTAAARALRMAGCARVGAITTARVVAGGQGTRVG